MKVATFNANSVRSRLDIVIPWLKEHRPDVLCLQETKVQDKDFPVQPFVEAGYQAVFRGEKSYNGVALISTARLLDVTYGLDDGGDSDEARLIHAVVGSVHVVNTYVPQGREIDHPMYQYKIEWFDRLRAYFDRHFSPRGKVVWLGDLNIAPEPQDVHNPEEQTTHVCFHADIRQAFERTKAWGFEDVFRKHNPGPGQYTFFDYTIPNSVKRRMGWRVDHILATRPLASRSVASYIDLKPRLADRPSDHTFLVAEFDLG